MKKVFLLLIVNWSLLIVNCFAQSITWQRVLNNNYGGLNKVQQTYDGGYVAVGTDVINGLPKIYFTKLDYLGNTLWTKIYGVGYTGGYWVEETTDRGFIIAGYTDSGMVDDDAYIIKTDSVGNIQWHRTYDYSDLDQCTCVKQTSDGGYILSCRITPLDINGVWFIKTDNYGNVVWQKVYHDSNMQIKAYMDIEILSNGYMSVGNIQPVGSFNSDIYIIRLNIVGDTLWTKKYGGGVTQEVGISMDKIGNSGFIIAGYSVSYSPNRTNSYLVKIDTLGNFIWQREYNTGLDERCYSVLYKQNIGFVMAGAADTNVINHFNARIRVVDTAGNILNIKSFYPDVRGGWFNDISQTSDGGYILGGASNGATQVKMYAVKTDSLLFANPIGIINYKNEIPHNFVLFQNYPNPFNSKTTIRFGITGFANVKLKLYDCVGRYINELVNTDLNAGTYIIRIDANDLQLASGVYYCMPLINNSLMFNQAKKLIYIK